MNEKLLKIQSELKAPKGQMNSFGNYKYRSCEDILEAVKPLLKVHGLTLVLGDEVVNIGNHNYIKATATIGDKEDRMWTTAYAREAEVKKGMDDAQITGACSSYARKYALNGLFAIDDTKDADTKDNSNYESQKPLPQGTSFKATKKQLGDMFALVKEQEGFTDASLIVEWVEERFGKDPREMSLKEAQDVIGELRDEPNGEN